MRQETRTPFRKHGHRSNGRGWGPSLGRKAWWGRYKCVIDLRGRSETCDWVEWRGGGSARGREAIYFHSKEHGLWNSAARFKVQLNPLPGRDIGQVSSHLCVSGDDTLMSYLIELLWTNSYTALRILSLLNMRWLSLEWLLFLLPSSLSTRSSTLPSLGPLLVPQVSWPAGSREKYKMIWRILQDWDSEKNKETTKNSQAWLLQLTHRLYWGGKEIVLNDTAWQIRD